MLLLLQFRLLQTFRALREVGVGLLIIAIVITAGLWVNGLAWLANLPFTVVAIASFLTGLSIHFSRSDKAFISKRETAAWRSLFVDNFLLAIALAIPFIIMGKWLIALAPFSTLFCSFFPLKNTYGSKNTIHYSPTLSLRYFEWQSLIRKRFGWVILIGIIQIGCFFHIGFFGLFLLLLIGLLPEAFTINESRVLAPQNWQDLLRKNWNLSLSLLVFCSPSILFSLWNNFDWWILVLYGLLAIFAVFQLFFWYKYANWSPFYPHNNNTTIGMISFFCVLLPGFILIGMAMALRNFYKAKKRNS